MQILDQAERDLSPADNMVLPTRILHLPMAFNERWTHDAINRQVCGAVWGTNCRQPCRAAL